jgi:hypothetical protein
MGVMGVLRRGVWRRYKDPEEVGPVLQFLAGLGEQPEL